MPPFAMSFSDVMGNATDLGIDLESGSGVLSLEFPRPNMGAVIRVTRSVT